MLEVLRAMHQSRGFLAKKLTPRSVFGATAVANLLVGAVSIFLFGHRGWSV